MRTLVLRSLRSLLVIVCIRGGQLPASGLWCRAATRLSAASPGLRASAATSTALRSSPAVAYGPPVYARPRGIVVAPKVPPTKCPSRPISRVTNTCRAPRWSTTAATTRLLVGVGIPPLRPEITMVAVVAHFCSTRSSLPRLSTQLSYTIRAALKSSNGRLTLTAPIVTSSGASLCSTSAARPCRDRHWCAAQNRACRRLTCRRAFRREGRGDRTFGVSVHALPRH